MSEKTKPIEVKPFYFVNCGKAKLNHGAPASQLYTGTYFRLCLNYALMRAPSSDIRIISAKHGIVALNKDLAPYECRMGDRDSISIVELAIQLGNLNAKQGIFTRPLVVVAGADYCKAIEEAIGLAFHWWEEENPGASLPQIEMPILLEGGIGKKQAWLKANMKNEVI